jgi:hypothetical protein
MFIFSYLSIAIIVALLQKFAKLPLNLNYLYTLLQCKNSY